MFTFTHRNPEMQLEKGRTAVVLTDIQNEFLTPNVGNYHAMIKESLEERHVADHIEQLLQCAKAHDYYVIHSPHYYFATDGQWVAPLGAISDYLFNIGFVGRKDPVDLEGFQGSPADYPERFKKYLMDGKTANVSPHKGFGCAGSNDLIKQLRQRRIEKVIMAGPVGNICLESHVRDLIEAGFEVAVVRDAIAGGRNEEGDGYQAAMTNFRFMVNAVWTTEETVARMKAAATAAA